MRRIACGIAIVAVALAGVGTGAHNPGGNSESNRSCGEGSLRGAYGVQFQGTRPVRPPFPPGIESYAGIAIRTYDGEGQFTQISNVKGSVIGVEADVVSEGTYVVNEDCSGSHSAQFVPSVPPITDRFVIMDAGREVRFVVMTPVAIMNVGILQKLHAR